MEPATVFTLGHSTRPIDEFLTLLKQNGIKLLVDVRKIPKSRHNPQYGGTALARSLKAAGIAYRPAPALGGLRRPTGDARNAGWRNASFRGYADYMQTPEFREALGRLLEQARARRTVILCAEAVPWRCHRNLIADALVARGARVEHIVGARAISLHRLAPWAKAQGGNVTYPAEPTEGGEKPMAKVFRIGDRVSWNSEAGRVRGRIIRKLTRPTRFKGYLRHASRSNPQYLIQSEKTDHVAAHQGKALRKLKARRA